MHNIRGLYVKSVTLIGVNLDIVSLILFLTINIVSRPRNKISNRSAKSFIFNSIRKRIRLWFCYNQKGNRHELKNYYGDSVPSHVMVLNSSVNFTYDAERSGYI